MALETSEIDKNVYENVLSEINTIIDSANQINLTHSASEEIKEKLINGLKAFKNKFSKDVKELKNRSEWDKYTIAFFGETNAGKSTLIEALRILGKERGKETEYRE